MTTVSSSPRWLSEREQRAWRAFVAVSSVVMAELDADLESTHGLSLGEYAVLVELSEAPDQRLRMTDLAGRLHLSPSGLTRRFDRLGRQGAGHPRSRAPRIAALSTPV